MAKRSRFEAEGLDVSDLNVATSSAIVHGAIIEVSPIKQSRKNKDIKYFKAKLTDGKKVARMVSFEPAFHKEIQKFKDNEETVSVTNCNVKESLDGEGFEVVIYNKSRISNSPKKFDIDKSKLLLLWMSSIFNLGF